MRKETKRSITYTILTILFMVTAHVNGGEDVSVVSYISGLLGAITGFIAIVNVIDVIKGK